jgi:Protein of unknown function (DUF3017)
MPGRVRGWISEQLASAFVLVVLAAGFGYLLVDPGRWRRSSGVIAVAVLLAAVLRAVLPPSWAGLLAVRSRWLDVAIYLALGGLILAVDIQLHA